MSILQFVVVMIIPLAISIYVFNFARWLWRQGNRMGGVGAYIITFLAGAGSGTYFLFKLLL